MGLLVVCSLHPSPNPPSSYYTSFLSVSFSSHYFTYSLSMLSKAITHSLTYFIYAQEFQKNYINSSLKGVSNMSFKNYCLMAHPGEILFKKSLKHTHMQLHIKYFLRHGHTLEYSLFLESHLKCQDDVIIQIKNKVSDCPDQ